MKKLLLSVAVLATVFTSCEKEANVIGTGSLKFTPVIESSNNLDINKKSNVDRGDIPVYVDAINLSINGASEMFNLTDGQVDGSEFIMHNVPTGQGTAVALTTTDSQELKTFTTSSIPNVFAIYNGNKDVNIGDNSSVAIDMTTNNGRIIVDFKRANYTDAITVKVTEGSTTIVLTEDTKFIWQGTDAVDAADASFKVEWFYGATLKATEDFTLTIKGNKSITTNVLISSEAFTKESVESFFNFTPVDEVPGDGIVIGDPNGKLSMDEITLADWNLVDGTFLATDGSSFAYVWARGDTNGAYNLAAAVYASADWNQELKNQAYQNVIDNVSTPKSWNLFVYDKYTNADLFNTWILEYGTNGVLNESKLRDTYYYYDAYGVVIGLYRAKEAGVMTQANYDASIVVATNRIAELGGITEGYQNAFFKLILEETGENLGVTAVSTVDATGFDAQDLGFAARAYGTSGITGLSATELEIELIRLANSTIYSLSSNDAIGGYYSIN